MIFGMNTRTVVMIGVALVAAMGTALFARGWLNAQRAAMADRGPVIEVLVARANTPAGHFIKAQDLRWQAWPKGTLAPTYVLKGKRKPKDFEGAVVRTGMAAGQPITDTLVVRPGDQGFLAAVLEPGKRAVSIQVNAITGISGFVFPGDRVDMVMTHTIRGKDRNSSRHVSETVLEDIRVLAVDQKTDDQNGKASIAKTMTFEVTPRQVEEIAIVNRIGKISLSLRPVAREPILEVGPETVGPDSVRPESVAENVHAVGMVAGTEPVEVASRGRAASLSPISAAGAAEVPAHEVAEEGAEDAPVPLMRVHPDRHPTAGHEAAEAADMAGEAVAAEAPAAPPAATRSKVVRIPRGERAGITMDSEVSRVIGRERHDSRRVVQVVRGAEDIEERRF